MSPCEVLDSQPQQAVRTDSQGTCAPELVGWASHSLTHVPLALLLCLRPELITWWERVIIACTLPPTRCISVYVQSDLCHQQIV